MYAKGRVVRLQGEGLRERVGRRKETERGMCSGFEKAGGGDLTEGWGGLGEAWGKSCRRVGKGAMGWLWLGKEG